MLARRYLSSHLYESIRDSELKVAKVSDFNDPFEQKFKLVGKYQKSNAERDFREQLRSSRFYDRCRESEKFSGQDNLQIKKFFQKPINKRKAIKDLRENSGVSKQVLVDRAHEIADEVFRVLCFTECHDIKPEDELLMWGHYANKHKGS